MFAYCNNNPVSYIDPTGHCACALSGGLDNNFKFAAMCPCGGGAGGSGASFILGYATFKFIDQISEVLTNTQAVAQEDEQVNVYVDAKTGQRKQYQYWEATLIGKRVVVGDGLTFVEASARVACGFNIMCANHNAAKWIVVVNCYWNAVGPEIHGDEGYYWHYHPHRNTHTHIWYYGVE